MDTRWDGAAGLNVRTHSVYSTPRGDLSSRSDDPRTLVTSSAMTATTMTTAARKILTLATCGRARRPGVSRVVSGKCSRIWPRSASLGRTTPLPRVGGVKRSWHVPAQPDGQYYQRAAAARAVVIASPMHRYTDRDERFGRA